MSFPSIRHGVFKFMSINFQSSTSEHFIASESTKKFSWDWRSTIESKTAATFFIKDRHVTKFGLTTSRQTQFIGSHGAHVQEHRSILLRFNSANDGLIRRFKLFQTM